MRTTGWTEPHVSTAQHRRRRHGCRWIVLAASGLALSWLGALAATFALSRRIGEPAEERLPPGASTSIEDLRIRASDGVEFGAWLFAPDAPGPSIVMAHGWRGSRSTLVGRASALCERGASVLALSLRAHGDSGGATYDFGIDAWRDVVAGVELLERRRPGRPIVLVGFSYGASAVAFAAAELEGRIEGCVLDSLFADVASAMRRRCELFLPPALDVLAWTVVQSCAPFTLPRLSEMDAVAACRRIPATTRVVLLRGGGDRRVHADETASLAAALRGPVDTLVFDGADHDRLFEHDRARWTAAVASLWAR